MNSGRDSSRESGQETGRGLCLAWQPRKAAFARGRLGRVLAALFLIWLTAAPVRAQVAAAPAPAGGVGAFGVRIQLDSGEETEGYSKSLRVLLLITALSLAPSAIIMMTSFTRILVVLGFLRQALGTQQEPPGQLLAAMALFLTIFIMMPVWTQVNSEGLQPYINKQLSESEAWDRGVAPLKKFMLQQTGEKELKLFIELSRKPAPAEAKDISLETLVPAFVLSELKTAFQMGFLLYLPFLVIDLVIASSLMSLGMMMLPPMMISLPIKLLFFVLADGWTLVVRGIVASFVT